MKRFTVFIVLLMLFSTVCFADYSARIQELSESNQQIDQMITLRQEQINQLVQIRMENIGRIKELQRLEQEEKALQEKEDKKVEKIEQEKQDLLNEEKEEEGKDEKVNKLTD